MALSAETTALAEKVFSKMKEAKASLDSNWEKEGHYLQRVNRVKLDQNRKKQAGFFVEKTIIHVFDDADSKGHRTGEEITHAMWDHHESFLGNVKAFVVNLLKVPAAEVDLEQALLVIDDSQPLAGMIIEVKSRVIMTKSDKPFTKITYVGEVPASELEEHLTAEEVALHFPDGLLGRMIALEEEQKAEAAA